MEPARDTQEEPALALKGVRFAYDGDDVLRGVDLDVPAGCFFGLLGPNGAGKSTLIGVLCGALRARAGAVRVMGRAIGRWDRNALARRVAVVPQKFDLAFPYTVEEVVLLGRTPHRGPLALDRHEDVRIAEQAMEATEVLHLRGRRVHELSGGEFKRVVVAKALAQQPRVLLLDEPAAHLDIRHQVGLYELIESIRRQTGVTVVSAMHDLNLAAAYCEQVSLLRDGQVFCTGSIEEVMTYNNLREVYQVDIYVGVNDLTGHRLFTPMVTERP